MLPAECHGCRIIWKEPGVYTVPLRIGGGIRLKILEAMAAGQGDCQYIHRMRRAGGTKRCSSFD